jgi:hypothetical protein
MENQKAALIQADPKLLLSQGEVASILQFYSDRDTNYDAYKRAFRKVVYSQQLYENNRFSFLKNSVSEFLDEPCVFLNYIYLEVDDGSIGFSWHCDKNNVQPLVCPYDAFSIWITLSDVTEVTGGRLLTATDEVAQTISRMVYMMSDVPGLSFKKPSDRILLSNITLADGDECLTLDKYFDKVAVAANMSAGQGILLNNALFHKTERPNSKHERICYVMRFVRGDKVRISRKRLEILRQWGTAQEHVSRYESLLKNGMAILEE